MPIPTSSPLTKYIDVWQKELADDRDKEFILDGIRHGFRLTDPDQDIKEVECANYQSATRPDRRPIVEQQLKEEISKGYIITTSKKPRIINAIGAVPKDNSPELRLITDASRPQGASLNSYMTVNPFKFETVDTAVSLLDKDYYQCKLDLRHGYRSIPIHRDDYQLCGSKWCFDGSTQPTYLMDTRLCFGAAKAPQIFQRITSAVARIVQRAGHSCLVYLDDFYVCGPTYNEALAAYQFLHQLLLDLGFIINEAKCLGPTQRLPFLGIMIDSHEQTLSMPEQKLEDLRSELSRWEGKKRATKRDLQRLLGRINWVARVVRAARPFMRRLINLLRTASRPNHHIRLSAGAKQDLAWLATLSVHFNGVAYWLTTKPLPDHAIATDASSHAAAAVHAGDYVYSDFTADYPELLEQPIHVKELYAILLAFRRWAPIWRDKMVHVFTDNTVAMAAVNKGSSLCTRSMPLLREIYLLMAQHNIYVRAKRVDSKSNALADALSRMADMKYMIRASQLLREWDIPCCPHRMCNPFRHMTPGSLLLLFESWGSRNRSSIVNSQRTGGQSTPTRPC